MTYKIQFIGMLLKSVLLSSLIIQAIEKKVNKMLKISYKKFLSYVARQQGIKPSARINRFSVLPYILEYCIL